MLHIQLMMSQTPFDENLCLVHSLLVRTGALELNTWGHFSFEFDGRFWAQMNFSHMLGDAGVRLCEVCPGESSSFQPSPRKKKRQSQLLLHPKHPLFTLRPCDARFVFWPGDCWCWNGSTGRLKLCNNMTHAPAGYPVFSPPGGSGSFWKALPCVYMAAVAFGVLVKFSISRWTFLVPSSLTTSLIPHFTGIRGSRNPFCIWEDVVPSQLTP